ncbi:hypothetical protein [Evansella tamaricis]|uniref:Uncharacterized protein n=1 Tax=Evansella tamaricis TaxID=2069301 RepID=A0ABS6JCG9_9BACI|nr:hypothetical protein [Evansella tamaricis]MBU9711120.1 hypothetical protein [Evansella tamaricis]
MWVYYEEIDGLLNPKWVIINAEKENNFPFYKVNGPFERFFEEDMTDEFRGVTVTMAYLIRDPFEDLSFGITVASLKEKYNLDDVTHFILLVDDLQEILNMDISEQLLIV